MSLNNGSTVSYEGTDDPYTSISCTWLFEDCDKATQRRDKYTYNMQKFGARVGYVYDKIYNTYTLSFLYWKPVKLIKRYIPVLLNVPKQHKQFYYYSGMPSRNCGRHFDRKVKCK